MNQVRFLNNQILFTPNQIALGDDCCCGSCATCDEVYNSMFNGITGVEIDGFSSSLFDATSLNGIYLIPESTGVGDCLKGVTQKICSTQSHPGFFLGSSLGYDLYLTNMIFIGESPCNDDFGICGDNLLGEDAPIVVTIGFRGQCINSSPQFTVTVSVWYPLFAFLPPSSNFWYCVNRFGIKITSSIEDLFGPIALSSSVYPDLITGSITANII